MAELLHHRADDAGPGKDDLGARRLESDDLAPPVHVARSVQLDLAIDLFAIEDRPWTTSGS